MGFFKRLFSSSRDTARKARRAEAAGDLERAAALYAEADDLPRVLRIHRLRAAQAHDRRERLAILRLALSLTDPARTDAELDPALRRDIALDLARALVEEVDEAGILDRRDKALVEEAAELFMAHGEPEAAGDAWARIGYRNKAARAYTEAGHVEKLDAVIARDEAERDPRRHSAALVDEFEFAREHGLLLDARRALLRAIEVDPDNPRLRDLRTRFERNLPDGGCLRLALDGAPGAVVLMSADSLTIGRDEHADLALLAPGVSRLHARLTREPDGDIVLEDLGSRHGTFVDDQPCEPAANLGPHGVIRLGQRCELDYRVRDGGCIELVPRLASARDTWFVWGQRWQAPDDAPLGGALSFELVEGYWHLAPVAELQIDGRIVNQPMLLCLDTRLTLPDGRRAVVHPGAGS